MEEFSVEGGNRCVGCATLAALTLIVVVAAIVLMALAKG